MSHLAHILHIGEHVFHGPLAFCGFVLGGFLGHEALKPDLTRCHHGFGSPTIEEILKPCTINSWGSNMWGSVGVVDPIVGVVVGGIIGGILGLLIYALAKKWGLAPKAEA